MKLAPHRDTEKGSLELIEEGVHLLRTTPIGGLASYYLGSLPLVMGALFFWADMSRSPFAYQHLAGTSFAMALLFLWMKLWHGIAAFHFRAALASIPPQPVSLKLCGRILLSQTILQSTGLFLVPLALALTLPFAWVFAFYENATAFAASESVNHRMLIRKSLRQATLWPKQNHVLLGVLFGLGLFVFLNWATVCFLLPRAVKMLFGIESPYTRGGLSLLNSTFFAVVFGLTYLCVDPLVKAIYVLRCFYGESIESGEDLRAELREFAAPTPKYLVAGVVLAAMLASCSVINAAETQGSPKHTSQNANEGYPSQESGAGSQRSVRPDYAIPAEQLDRTIQEVMQQSKYTWRMPRERAQEEKEVKEGIIDRFMHRVAALLKEWLKALGRWLDSLLRRLFWRNRPVQPSSSGYSWILAQEFLLGVLVVAVLGGLGFLVYRLWQNRRPASAPLASEPVQTVPDLADENLGADQLPEDGWTRLGREFLARGELRLALRAFYLASLAHLAKRHLISLAKFKSNRDYETELRRRGHSLPDLLRLFGINVTVFERTWYGLHEVTRDAVAEFAANVERMRELA